MTITKAKKILNDNGISWSNYIDLCFIERSRDNWIECEHIQEAIKRIKLFLLHRI